MKIDKIHFLILGYALDIDADLQWMFTTISMELIEIRKNSDGTEVYIFAKQPGAERLSDIVESLVDLVRNGLLVIADSKGKIVGDQNGFEMNWIWTGNFKITTRGREVYQNTPNNMGV